ncbi:hypothetical protein GF420_15945 [candidate division GN15 bacterium]|nr:hypothetical protein [candidate division GN15 bacterium]
MMYGAFIAGVLVTVIIAAGGTAVAQDTKSVRTARWSSVAATVIPGLIGAALIASGDRGEDNSRMFAGGIVSFGGVVFGPGAGHRYADKESRFNRGALVRGLVGVVGYTSAVALSGSMDLRTQGEDTGYDDGAVFVAAVAGGVMLGHAIYDIVGVEKSVAEYNDPPTRMRVTLSPYYTLKNGGVGLQLSVLF